MRLGTAHLGRVIRQSESVDGSSKFNITVSLRSDRIYIRRYVPLNIFYVFLALLVWLYSPACEMRERVDLTTRRAHAPL